FIEAFSTFGEGSIQKGFVAGAQVAAIDPDPSVLTFKTEAVALAVGGFDAAVNIVSFGAFDVLNDAIRVGELNVVIADSGVAAGNGIRQLFTFNELGCRQSNRPQGDIVVVRSPIG